MTSWTAERWPGHLHSRWSIVPKLHEVKEGERVTYAPSDLEFVAVNHSIPDGLAVAIRTGAGVVLRTGDFKMGPVPAEPADHRPA